MRCVMLATEGEYMEMAHMTAPRASRILGHEVEILCFPKNHDIFLEKMRLIHKYRDPLLCMDADMVVLDWNWSDFDTDKFSAVADYNLWRWAPELDELFPIEKAVNGGLWLANRDCHASIFYFAEGLMLGALKDHPKKLGDQTALNRSLHLSKTPVHFLSTAYNYQVRPGAAFREAQGSRVIHLVGGASWLTGKPESDGEKLLRVEACIKEFPE